jgi:porphobilinogen synthase
MNRPRRLRQSPAMRALVRETHLNPSQLVLPLFVRAGRKLRRPIVSMPGVFQLSPDELVKEARAAFTSGVPAVLLFGIPERKDERASGAYARNGIVQQAVRLLKRELPELLVITDVCLCEYMAHGHCGIVQRGKRGDTILNDPSVKLLARTAASHAEAGADIVAPSDMMDGRVAAIRAELDRTGFTDTPMRRRSTVRSATRRNLRPSLVTAAVTRWTPPMRTKRCAKWHWTSRKARTS